MHNIHAGTKCARLLPRLAAAALFFILPLTSTLAQDQPRQQLERRLSYNLGATNNPGGTSNLLSWMKSTRYVGTDKKAKSTRQEKQEPVLYVGAGKRASAAKDPKPKSYFMIPVILNFNSDNAAACLRTKNLADMMLTANAQRPKDMEAAEAFIKDLQQIPKTEAIITLDEVSRFGWQLKNLRLDFHAGARLWTDYSYSGVGKYSKQGDTLIFSSLQQSLFALAAVDFLGGVRLTVPWHFSGSGTLNVAPEISYGYRMAWQGYVLVGDKVANSKEVRFMPEEYVRARLRILSLGFSASFEPEKHTQMFRFLSPKFGVRVSNLFYSASSSYTGVQGKGPQLLGQRSVEFGMLTSPAGLLDAGMSITVSPLAPQYGIEVSYLPTSDVGLSISASFNKPDLFLQPQNSYSLTATFGNDNVHFVVPLSLSGRGIGIGFGFHLGSNLSNSPR